MGNAGDSDLLHRLRGVVFDLDGTLVSQELDFEAIRREIGLPAGQPLLEALERMGGVEYERAAAILERHEQAAAGAARLHAGVPDFLRLLTECRIPRAVLSRNSRRSVMEVVQRFGLSFDPIVAREDAPYKPNPQGLLAICGAWGCAPCDILMIGDYVYDVQVGRKAGARTALITHGRDLSFAHLADFTFPSFLELPDLLLAWLDRRP